VEKELKLIAFSYVFNYSNYAETLNNPFTSLHLSTCRRHVIGSNMSDKNNNNKAVNATYVVQNIIFLRAKWDFDIYKSVNFIIIHVHVFVWIEWQWIRVNLHFFLDYKVVKKNIGHLSAFLILIQKYICSFVFLYWAQYIIYQACCLLCQLLFF
jgi:hypothetical protein